MLETVEKHFDDQGALHLGKYPVDSELSPSSQHRRLRSVDRLGTVLKAQAITAVKRHNQVPRQKCSSVLILTLGIGFTSMIVHMHNWT